MVFFRFLWIRSLPISMMGRLGLSIAVHFLVQHLMLQAGKHLNLIIYCLAIGFLKFEKIELAGQART